ncbi:MAG: PAS domain S-box protein [Ideonella sp.]|nr:PAS domain S-box protein [Ideonella sp.]MCC7457113.1 PAS domain S-box protein [Nitrospira sp.]
MTAFSFDRKYMAALAVALLVFVALALARWHSVEELRSTLTVAREARHAQQQFFAVYRALREVEISHRDYLLAPQTALLKRHRSALARLDAAMRALESQQAARPDRAPHLAAVRALLDDRVAALAHAVRLRESQGLDAALAMAHSEEPQQLTMGIRDVLERMGQEDEVLLAAHEARTQATVARNEWQTAAAMATGAVFLLAILVLMRRERAVRLRTRQLEVDQRDQLERAVRQRTGELDQALAALAASESRVRGILESATDAILTVDDNMQIVMANPAAARMFGLPSDDLIGTSLERLIPEPVHAQHDAAPAAAVEPSSASHPRHAPREVIGRRADGSKFPLEASTSRAVVDGKALHTAILRDLTEVKKTQAALRHSEARFRDVLVRLPEPVLIRTGGRIVFANEAAQELFGVDEHALIGRAPPEFCDHIGERPGEVTLERPDGSARVVLATGAAIEFQGQRSLIVMLRDLSELRRAERELAATNADLQRLVSQQDRVQEDERRRIARELHDELQQPLAAIVINLSAAAGQLGRDPRGAARALASAEELANGVIDSTRRIVKALRPQMLDDLGLVAALEALGDQFAATTGIVCTVQADDDADAFAMASPPVATCLYRVAQESLNNVLKHADASAVQVHLTMTSAQELCLRIRDDGRGIDAQALRKPESFGLLGIGERLRALGGTLDVHGTSGAGTTVQARLPVAEPATA